MKRGIRESGKDNSNSKLRKSIGLGVFSLDYKPPERGSSLASGAPIACWASPQIGHLAAHVSLRQNSTVQWRAGKVYNLVSLGAMH